MSGTWTTESRMVFRQRRACVCDKKGSGVVRNGRLADWQTGRLADRRPTESGTPSVQRYRNERREKRGAQAKRCDNSETASPLFLGLRLASGPPQAYHRRPGN